MIKINNNSLIEALEEFLTGEELDDVIKDSILDFKIYETYSKTKRFLIENLDTDSQYVLIETKFSKNDINFLINVLSDIMSKLNIIDDSLIFILEELNVGNFYKIDGTI